ncbi:TetR family transcriptional regulator [Luteimicrobium album]|uniref:TetR family transcriptional regulator n=1 Tax=Luteimicrobium album TaxID=1054550 RepID=A0ABQ6I780_9MICO|nr:TetR family transcriptional regulator [Luteimicrobium album]
MSPAAAELVEPASPTEAPALGTRERKKRATRRALIASAQELVGERGLDGATIEDICERAGVARRTFFNYFDTKEDAALGWSEDAVDPSAGELFAAGGPTGILLDDLVTLVGTVLAAHDFRHDEVHHKGELVRGEPRLLARQLWRFEQTMTATADLFRRRGERDVDDQPLDGEVGAFLVVSLVRLTHQLWSVSGERGELADHLPVAVSQLRRLFAS